MPANDSSGARILAGAALPKAPQELKPRSRSGWRKVECFSCGAAVGMSRAQIRQGTHLCRCGAGLMVPADVDDCLELAPDLADRHPLILRAHQQDLAADLRAVDADRRQWGSSGRACASVTDPTVCECGWPRPDGADADHWLCPKCHRVNDHGRSSRTGVNGVEAERARGLVQRRAAVKPTATDLPETRAERSARLLNERLSDDLPF